MRNKEKTEFGHMHLSIFYRKVISLTESGLFYKRKYYPWSNIKSIELWQKKWIGHGYAPDLMPLPRASIYLSNGLRILLRGDVLVKRNAPLSKGFSSAIDELVAYLQSKKSEKSKVENNEKIA